MSGIKRSSEISSTSSLSKIIKLGDTLEIPDDVHLQTWQLDDEGSIIVHLVYDTLYENFFMTMIKKDEKGEKKIMLDIPNVNKLSAQMEKILLLCERYTSSGKSVTFSFDLGNEIWATLDNTYASMALDIRKFYTYEGVSRPTKSGVRVPNKPITKLGSTLVLLTDEIERIQEESSDIMTKCYIVLILEEIKSLHGLQKPFCEGCSIQHPSQEHHMGTNGCLNEEPPCWKKQVDYFFTVAIEAVKNEECLTRAEKVAKKLEKVLIRPVIKELSKNELKQTIVECKNWEDPIFLTAKDC